MKNRCQIRRKRVLSGEKTIRLKSELRSQTNEDGLQPFGRERSEEDRKRWRRFLINAEVRGRMSEAYELLRICVWREGLKAALGPDRSGEKGEGEWWRQRLGVAVVAIIAVKVPSRCAILLELGDISTTFTALDQ